MAACLVASWDSSRHSICGEDSGQGQKGEELTDLLFRVKHDPEVSSFNGHNCPLDVVPILPKRKLRSRELGKLLIVEMVVHRSGVYGWKIK